MHLGFIFVFRLYFKMRTKITAHNQNIAITTNMHSFFRLFLFITFFSIIIAKVI
jgi:hypothetical protein